MSVDINWLAILAGTVTAMISGAVWYDPRVFGMKWMKSIKLTKKQMDAGQTKGMIAAMVRSFVLSFSLYHIIYVTADFYSDKSFLSNAIGVGLWVGMAIVGLTMLMHDVFEQRSTITTKINVRYEILTVLLVSVAIGIVAG